ncbi:MAG: bifunctional 5,10-methylenetetrahydrofolate dehydrogenase/5,10-methenyltetrahydrofolate cyclohydrolase [Armatimonadetes bacterium]|nr:bifunctional 5,10-methylenetetrahydrofolate dehydrogenase/5,10-methenyltetrahydrofolate cyclohydrolase [Armatimonadota bacterium]MBS1711202.1 bifunctional 5,10-methylenetetrahydrofolate dehydrogenase/5,10-methenyltetrahydrofolate cyclohydrolase [Armatimonadota bacterium]MBX3108876.1 bifunctional 5,10-methylenetetrahydrofolate dehydrogenase/5,10-methenyltetrahydrofolate cyclohydrolase [Fimbriimonadaceae bacterium]
MSDPVILDGRALAREVREDLKRRVAALKASGISPKLEAVVAAQDPASLAYVEMKRKWAGWVGVESGSFMVDSSVSERALMDHVAQLNEDSDVHGVLIQHPLPPHIDEDRVLESLGPEKDVDGITSASLGRLTAGLPGFRCATPLGITKLLARHGIECAGKNALVIGRSNILGKPMALMLLELNATVTVAHSKTQDLASLCRTMDIVVAAVGRPEMVKGDWIRPGATVIDAGYNKVEGRGHDVGDCDYEACAAVAGAITPVPGGVGPMTVASLLENTVLAAEARLV